MPGLRFRLTWTAILILTILFAISYQSTIQNLENTDIPQGILSLRNDASSSNNPPKKLNLRGRNLDLKSENSDAISSHSQDSLQNNFRHYLMQFSKVNNELVSAIMTSLALLTNILQPGNPAPLLLMVLSKMPRIVNQVALKSFIFDTEMKSDNWNLLPITTSFGPKISETYKQNFPHYQLPSVFSEQNYSSSYLVNNWQNLSTFAIILITTGIILSLEYICRKLSLKCQIVFEYLKPRLKWNIFFVVFLSNVDDLTLFSYFEISTFQPENSFSVLSMMSCIATIGIAFAIIWTYLKMTDRIKIPQRPQLSKRSTSGSLGDILTQRESYLIFTEGFKTETVFKRKFLLIFLLRVITSNIIITWLYQDLTLQAILFTFISCTMIACIALHNPFRQKSLQIQVIVVEALMLVLNFSLILLSLYQDKILHNSQSFKKNLEYTLLTCLSLFSILFKLLIVIIFGQTARATYRAYKAKNKPTEVSVELSPSHLRYRNPKFQNLVVFSPSRSFLPHKEEPAQEDNDQQGQEEGERTWKKLRIIAGIEISLGDSPARPPEVKPREEKSGFRRQDGNKSGDNSQVRLTKEPEQDKSDMTEKTPETSLNMRSRFNVQGIMKGINTGKYQKFTHEAEQEQPERLNGENLTFQDMAE